MPYYAPKNFHLTNRRNFLKGGLIAGAGALFATRFAGAADAPAAAPLMAVPQPSAPPSGAPTRVALTNGDNRTDNVFRGLKSLEKEIARSIGDRRVVIKPNNVSPTNQLASSHADALEGILEFLQSIGKLDHAIIAESALANTMQSFENFGYPRLAEKYKVKLVDLDQESFQTILAFSESDAMPHPVRVSNVLADQKNNFIISACMLKTHDRAVATLSLKNIVLGAPLKLPNPNSTGGRGRVGNDKPILHGGGAHGININLAMLAPLLHPSLSVIDGFQGMEGNGPLSGTAVDHRVCVVSNDFVAADAVGASLMGIAPADIGYLSYLSKAKIGEIDPGKMEILGEPIEKLAKKYVLSASAQNQFKWKEPAHVAGNS